MTELSVQICPMDLETGQQAQSSCFDSVVIISPFFWNFRDDMWQTTHNVAREFARLAPTVLVEPPVQWNPRSAEFRVHRLLHSIFGVRTRVPLPNLTVFHRRGLPLGRWESVRNFVVARNARSLSHYLKKLRFSRTLLWHSFCYWSEPLVEANDHTLLAYHCLDHCAREEEVGLVRRADVIFCVSQTLVDKHKRINPHAYLLPNGVDLTLFDRARVLAGPRPGDLPASGRILGFLGYVNYHVDIELLVEVARAFPNDHLILVGRVPATDTAPQGRQREALRRLQTMPNVRILGFKPTRELPFYLQAFDVCLIPFLKDPFNEECDPLKFYQYMAMGKPVVSAPVPVAKRYRDLCYVAESHEAFLAQVSRALEEGNSETLQQARVAAAQAHSWRELVAQACAVLKKPVVAKAAPPA